MQDQNVQNNDTQMFIPEVNGVRRLDICWVGIELSWENYPPTWA